MTKSYVAHNIGRFHQLVQRLGNEILSNVICKTGNCWQASGKNVIGIYSDSARSMDDREKKQLLFISAWENSKTREWQVLYKPGASLFGQSVRRPIANARAMNVYRDAVLIRSKNSLHFVFAEGVQEIGEAKGSILDWTAFAMRTR